MDGENGHKLKKNKKPEQVRVRTRRSTVEGQGRSQNKSEEGTK